MNITHRRVPFGKLTLAMGFAGAMILGGCQEFEDPLDQTPEDQRIKDAGMDAENPAADFSGPYEVKQREPTAEVHYSESGSPNTPLADPDPVLEVTETGDGQ